MSTVTLDRMIYTRTLSEVLGVGGRTCTATVTATGVKDDEDNVTKASTIQISQISNMTEAELTAYQTFVATLDEVCTELEAALYVEPGP